MTEAVTVTTADGVSIACRFHAPVDTPHAAVLVVPAMGTRQYFYSAFADWLAERGFLVATLDYRGMGDSRRGGLRGFEADILDWARLDCAAVVEALAARAPGKPIVWVGHSLGGQTLPFLPDYSRIARALFIATGNGHWRINSPPTRWRAFLLWHLIGPALVGAFGYFPGARLRMIGDLPRGVYRQWRRWCLHPDYARGVESAEEAYASVRIPILSVSFTDDEMMSATSTSKIESAYPNADLRALRLAPADLGVGRIGHFGCFRPGFMETLWERHLLAGVAGHV